MSRDGFLLVGVAGLGFGEKVLIPSLQGRSDVRVGAVAARNPEHARDLAARLGDGVEVARDGVALAGLSHLDAIVVAVPPEAQMPIVVAAVDAGKAVFCEKPFGLTVAEAECMTKAATNAGVGTAVGFEFRYDPGLASLIDAVAAGRVGAIHRVRVEWLTSGGLNPGRRFEWRHDRERGGGVLPEFCSHVLDYVSLMTGADINNATMMDDVVVAERPDAKGGRRKITTADRCELIVRMGAVMAHLSVSNAEPISRGHLVEVQGETGRLLYHHIPPFGPGDVSLSLERGCGRESIPINGFEPNVPDSRITAVRRLFDDFFRSLHGQACPRLPTFDTGLAVRRAMALAEESATRHAEVQ